MYSPRKKRPTSRRYHSKHYAPSLSYRRFNLAYHQQRGLTMDISPSTAKQTPIHMPTYQSVQAEIERIYQSGILDKMYPDFPGGIMPIQYVVTTLDDWNLNPSFPTTPAYINPGIFDIWLHDPSKLQAFDLNLPPAGWHWICDIVNITYNAIDNSKRCFRLHLNVPTGTGASYYSRDLIYRDSDLTGVMNPDSDINLPPLSFVTNDNVVTMFNFTNATTTDWTVSRNNLSGIRIPLGEIFYNTLGYIPYMTNRPEVMALSNRQNWEITLLPDSATLAELPVADKFTFEIVAYLEAD